MPIYVPYSDVQYLGNNANFQQININAGTLASGTLNLDLIGTNTSSLSYAFPGVSRSHQERHWPWGPMFPSTSSRPDSH